MGLPRFGLRMAVFAVAGLIVFGLYRLNPTEATSGDPPATAGTPADGPKEEPPRAAEVPSEARTRTTAERFPPTLRRVLRIASDGFLVAVLVFAVFLGYGLVNNRWYHILAVTGGSMSPTIQAGDLIVITRPPQQVEPGMILTLEVDRSLVTHRVVQVNPDGSFVTQGDANDVRDEFSGNKIRVVGQYQFRIPLIGGLLPAVNPQPADTSGAWFVVRQQLGVTGMAGTWELAPVTISQPPQNDASP